VNPIERRVRNMINPYSTAFATWWCDFSRYWRLPRMITGKRASARPGLPRPAVHYAAASTAGQPSRLTDLLTGPGERCETTRDTDDSSSLVVLVSKTHERAGDAGDVSHSALNPATTGRPVTAEVTATTPHNGSPGLTAAAVYSKVAASYQVAARN
jgi:hypothetical protein